MVKGLVIRRDGKVCDIEISVRPYALKEGEGEGWQTSPLVGELRAMAEAPDPHVRAEALRDLALLEKVRASPVKTSKTGRSCSSISRTPTTT